MLKNAVAVFMQWSVLIAQLNQINKLTDCMKWHSIIIIKKIYKVPLSEGQWRPVQGLSRI